MLDPELDLAENDDVEALGGLAALEQDRTAVHMQGLGLCGDPVDLLRSQFAKQRHVGEKRLDPYRGRRHGTHRPGRQVSRAQAARRPRPEIARVSARRDACERHSR